jgi:hypothetical protein
MVKEAAERGIIMLRAQKASLHRQIREQVATEGSSGHKTGFIAGGEVLTPFVLACNHADASVSILSVSISAIQRLLTNDCIERENFPNIMRVLRIQALSEHQEVLLKALQTMPLLTTPKRFDVPEDVIRQLFTIAFDLVASERPIIHHTASATLQQMMTLVFDRVESRLVGGVDEGTAKVDDDRDRRIQAERAAASGRPRSPMASPVGMSGNCRHAYLLFEDLCLLGKGERAAWVRDGSTPPQALALDIIETLLTSNTALFSESPEFTELLKSSVCPMIVEVLRTHREFPIVVRASRILSTLIAQFYQLLENELEVFVCILLDILPGRQKEPGSTTPQILRNSSLQSSADSNGHGEVHFDSETDAESSELPAWRCGMTLEILVPLVGNVHFMHYMYRTYDAVEGNTGLYGRVVDGISRLISFALNGGLHAAWGNALDGGSDSETGPVQTQKRGRVRSKGQDEIRPFIPMEALGAELDLESTKQSGSLDGDNRSSKWNKQKRILDQHNQHNAPHVTIGRIIWHAHECIASIVEGFVIEEGPDYYTPKKTEDVQTRNTLPLDLGPALVSASWAPVLASLENILRVCNEIHIVQIVLRSYQTYINACGVLNLTTPREGFLHSLCSFGFPRLTALSDETASKADQVKRRKCRSSKLVAHSELPLSEKNVQVLEAVFNIAHCLGGILGSSWQVVLEVCEQLNRMFSLSKNDAVVFPDDSAAIGASSFQGDVASEESMSILSFALDRLFESSKYLDDKGLHCMIEALGVLAIDSMSRAEFASPRASPVPSRSVSSEGGEKGARHHRGYVSAALSTISRFAGRKGKDSSGQDGRLIKRVQSSNDDTDSILSQESIPFAWKKLVVATQINIDRLPVIWELVSGHMETMCANKNEIVRAYGIQSLSLIISEALVYAPVVDGSTSPSLAKRRQSQTLPSRMQVVFLQSMEQCFTSGRTDVQEMVLDSVYSIIQNCGQVFDDAWPTVLKMLSLVANEHPAFVSFGFKSVQLIADDFLETLPVESADKIVESDAFFRCIKCLSDFASQTSDVNISLTAIGTLWAVGDYARRLVTSSSGGGVEEQDPPCVDGGHENSRANSIWMRVLKELERLAMDERAPVRNCALQSMFATLVTHGAHFAVDSWTKCLSPDGMVFSLMLAIERKCIGVEGDPRKDAGGNRKEAYMIVHHSRDTSAKQWNETRVIALQELSRTVRSFFDLLSGSDWFSVTWAEMLSVVRRALLLVREASTAEVAEVQREVVVAAVVVLGDLMSMAAAGASSESRTGNSAQIGLSLWRPTWDTLRELGEVEDFCFDAEEDLSRAVIKALARLWKSAAGSPLLTTEGQLSFFALADRILVNRPVTQGRYKHAKSPAEREYVELIKSITVTDGEARATLFQYLLDYSRFAASSPMFVLDAISLAVNMWATENTTKDRFREIVDVLSTIARRGVEDGIGKVTDGSFDLLVTAVLPSPDTVREDAAALVWTVWPTLLDNVEMTLSSAACSTALLDSVQNLASCSAAPTGFLKAFLTLLKQGSKKERKHKEVCQRYLFSMGEDNDQDVVIEQCEALLKQFRKDESTVNIADMALAMEGLLRVSKKTAAHDE